MAETEMVFGSRLGFGGFGNRHELRGIGTVSDTDTLSGTAMISVASATGTKFGHWRDLWAFGNRHDFGKPPRFRAFRKATRLRGHTYF